MWGCLSHSESTRTNNLDCGGASRLRKAFHRARPTSFSVDTALEFSAESQLRLRPLGVSPKSLAPLPAGLTRERKDRSHSRTKKPPNEADTHNRNRNRYVLYQP